MSVAVVEMPCAIIALHTLPGRIRVHIPGWSGQEKRKIETVLREVQGIRRIQTNALTGNVLIYFDPEVTNQQTILDVVQTLTFDTGRDLRGDPLRSPTPLQDEPAPPPVMRERQGKIIRARIAVRGLDRHPSVAKRVVEHIELR